jgi:hypothetical protein
MKVEFILDVGELLHMPLLTTFNSFLTEGFPEALCTRVVHVFFKRGDASEFDNYRGIMVGPILAKLFAIDALPSSLIDSNMSLKLKHRKNKESRHAPWFATIRG